jgi:ubiquinone/menaquinone biosynthesis C-methylase UbiE
MNDPSLGKEPTEIDDLPAYVEQMAAFHQAFQAELQLAVDSIPLSTTAKVLDLACGDGFYTRCFANRLAQGGLAIGVDLSFPYLQLAQRDEAALNAAGNIQAPSFVAGEFERLPFAKESFDLVWCAQSLYSLPEPVAALQTMRQFAAPGGMVAVLENDTLHQLLLPWPTRLELALRAAEYQAFRRETGRPGKYYVGRRLPAVFAAAGLEPLSIRTQAIDRQAPLSSAEETFLRGYLRNVAQRVRPLIEDELLEEFESLIDDSSPRYMLAHPQLSFTWLNILAIGRRPV